MLRSLDGSGLHALDFATPLQPETACASQKRSYNGVPSGRQKEKLPNLPNVAANTTLPRLVQLVLHSAPKAPQ
jgi:hypothetical protein